jgi:hypothetical protein
MPVHPFLFSFYTLIVLYAENISEASARDIWRPLIILFLITTLLLLLLRFLAGDWRRAGLLLSFLLLMFFSYGHVYNFLKENLQLNDVAIGDVYLFRHPVLVIVWVVLMCVESFLLLRIRDLRQPTLFLNSVAILMLVFPAYNIALHMYREQVYGSRTNVQTASLHVPDGSPLPDVYFIVLDAYGRRDVLQETFKLDNSAFLEELQGLGFYVVECSQSNYARTRLSIASTLNLDYIQNLIPEDAPGELNTQIKPYISDNKVRYELQEIGYKSVVFDNGFAWLRLKSTDFYLQKGEKTSIRLQLATTMTPFEEFFLRTTLFRSVIDLRLAGASVSSAPSQRETILYTLETLQKIPMISGPKFVYAHLILPHPPFVFGPNGEDIYLGHSGTELNDISFYADEAMRDAYRDQTIYTNKLIIPVLRTLIEESSVPPIIVLESDHGPTGYGGAKNRMGNLMAYYFPQKDVSSLAYSTITPVNSFRLVFNTYFGGDYPLLEDVSYFSEQTLNQSYEIVQSSCP